MKVINLFHQENTSDCLVRKYKGVYYIHVDDKTDIPKIAERLDIDPSLG